LFQNIIESLRGKDVQQEIYAEHDTELNVIRQRVAEYVVEEKLKIDLEKRQKEREAEELFANKIVVLEKSYKDQMSSLVMIISNI
jgi:hypothetical protein